MVNMADRRVVCLATSLNFFSSSLRSASPDRHTQAEEAERKEEEKKFKEVNEAYSVLSDKNKRARYDAGHDLEEEGGGPGGDFGDIDPNQIFQAFFGGGGGGMPGGFQFQFGGPGGHSHGGHSGHG